MFVACMLDAFPEHRDAVIQAAEAVAGTSCQLLAHGDGILTGARFMVAEAPGDAADGHHHLAHEHHHHQHGHRHWSDIRALLEASALSRAVKDHAIGIFSVLAEAEGRVHGVPPDSVAFHEVGAVDSIADIVAAAAIMSAIGPTRWTIAALPLGGGTVRTAHGVMPVPAPATALLLEGFILHDDGTGGERVTPTGAAILRYLHCQAPGATQGRLCRSGYGFGTRLLPGISNCLRALVFEVDAVAAGVEHRQLAVISFEVDDQSGEDLALGLDRVRMAEGVHDVVQMAAFGKKSRLAVHVQVLTRPDMLDDVVRLCFQETTTIGLRTHMVQGRTLTRRFAAGEIDGHSVTTKLVERPGGILTGKAEAEHLRDIASHAGRVQIRRQAEAQATTADLDQERTKR